MRTLYHIPTIHNVADTGKRRRDWEASVVAFLGDEKGKQMIFEMESEVDKVAESYWDVVEESFWKEKIDIPKAVVFQEGLCFEPSHELYYNARKASIGKARKDVFLGNALTRNYDIIDHMLLQGAAFAKTEDRSCYKGSVEKSVSKRDKYISKRINESLGEGRTGVLFLGSAHCAEKMLDKDIVVKQVADPAQYNERLDRTYDSICMKYGFPFR